MRRTKFATNTGQRGYALVLVMVALVTLTILGVTSIQSAQLDMKITQNMRHHKQLQYGALAGQDHARLLTDNWTGDEPRIAWDDLVDPLITPGGCILGWIGVDASAEEAPTPLTANTRELASYSVDFCRGVCGSPLPGEELGSGGGGGGAGNSSFSLDAIANGSLTGSTATARMGGLLIGTLEGGCGQ